METTVMQLTGTAKSVWLVPLLPLIAFLLISFVTREWGRLSAGLSIASLLGSLVLSLMVFCERCSLDAPPQRGTVPWISLIPKQDTANIDLGLLVDNYSALMLLMVCLVGLCIQIYSLAYMEKEIKHFPTQDSATISRFFGWLSLFCFSMLALVISSNLLQMYIFWELVGLCSYLLIGFWYFKTSAAKAAKKAFIVTRFGDLFFLMGILTLGLNFKSFDFVDIADKFSAGLPEGMTLGLTVTAGVLIFCGAIGKSAQFPLHIWLPDAMEGPTPVSALIHAATMVAAGVFLTARIFPILHPGGQATAAAALVAWVGVITALIAASIAVVQNDIKRVLAYSTISQLGFMMTALGIGAYTAGNFHLITHAFFKALLFLGAGAVIVACGSNDMWSFGGLRKKLPFTWLAFLIGSLALMGIPPLAGFWSKDEILSFAYGARGGMVFFVLLSLAALLTAFYITRLYFITFEGTYRGHDVAPKELAGPVPPGSLPQPVEPSPVVDFLPAWREEKALQGHDLPPACLGAHMEIHHQETPHEVSPVMWVPLLVLATFALFLGFVGVPRDFNWPIANLFGNFIFSKVMTHSSFSWVPMIVSVVVALVGAIAAGLLYGREAAAGEKKLRSWMGSIWTALQQKLYFDHLWAQLLSHTLFVGAKFSAFIDENIVDGAVIKVADFTQNNGLWLSEEVSGKVQHYLIAIFMCLIILALAIGYMEPSFATSCSSLLETFIK